MTRAFSEPQQHAQSPPLETTHHQVQANRIADQGAKLGVVPFDEEDAVTVIRVSAQAIDLAQEAILPLAEINAVLRQEHPADRYGQHACCSFFFCSLAISSLPLDLPDADGPATEPQFQVSFRLFACRLGVYARHLIYDRENPSLLSRSEMGARVAGFIAALGLCVS
jgi:hypothetical protein